MTNWTSAKVACRSAPIEGIETLTTKKANPARKAAARITASDFHRPGSGGSITGTGAAADIGRDGVEGAFMVDLSLLTASQIRGVSIILHRSLINCRERQA